MMKPYPNSNTNDIAIRRHSEQPDGRLVGIDQDNALWMDNEIYTKLGSVAEMLTLKDGFTVVSDDSVKIGYRVEMQDDTAFNRFMYYMELYGLLAREADEVPMTDDYIDALLDMVNLDRETFDQIPLIDNYLSKLGITTEYPIQSEIMHMTQFIELAYKPLFTKKGNHHA